MAPHPGLEPGTYRLTAGRSTKRARKAKLMVTCTRFELVNACVKGMCVKPLHQQAKKMERVMRIELT